VYTGLLLLSLDTDFLLTCSSLSWAFEEPGSLAALVSFLFRLLAVVTTGGADNVSFSSSITTALCATGAE
jgi:hypothetical protein